MLSPKPWRAELVLYSAVALFTSVCLGALISVVLQRTRVHGFAGVNDFGNIVIGTFSFQGVTWLLALIFLKLHHVRVRDALGARGWQLVRALGLALLVFAIVLPSAWLLQFVSIKALTRLGWSPESQFAVRLFENTKSWWSRGYLAVFAIVLAPVAEEFIFRGVLYPFSKQLGWPKLAFVSTSFLFALIHLDAATFIPLFALALALTWLYEITDVLLAPILVHMLFNAANLTMLVLVHLGYVPAS
jgi:membrane protease YdiL (CAAX protease family)